MVHVSCTHADAVTQPLHAHGLTLLDVLQNSAQAPDAHHEATQRLLEGLLMAVKGVNHGAANTQAARWAYRMPFWACCHCIILRHTAHAP
eukprot:1161979-Pelagomonas_calceolata.AAC.8